LDRPIQGVAEILSPYSNSGETTMLSILTEKALIVNPESRCQNAGHERAFPKCEDACPSPSLEIAKILIAVGRDWYDFRPLTDEERARLRQEFAKVWNEEPPS
jgi:hypothetical protein